MSQSTPPNDDSESNQDHISLVQPQYTYYRFLASLYAYSQAAYDLPSSGIGYANEISALSTVFPGPYPFETFNPSSFPTRSLDKAEDPSFSSVGEQDAVEPGKDTQSPNTPDAPSSSTPTSQGSMFQNARNLNFHGGSFINNVITESRNEYKRILVIIAFICFGIFLLFLGVYHRFATADLSTNVFPDLPPRADHTDIYYMNERDALKRLESFVSHGAINGSIEQIQDRQVHPGTRERVLSQIKDWIDTPNTTKHILWLHGPAGVGKSTIAQTITNSYPTGKVPATFFFLHSDPNRNEGNRLFTTLAWQFASTIPDIKGHIARSLNEQPDLPRKNVETQFQELIVRPFETLRNDMRLPQLSGLVVVIDGLDECVHEHLQERILNVIGNVATNILDPLRFLIISRPEAHINDVINRFKHHTLSIDLAKEADADRDIEKYLKDNFNYIAKDQVIDPAIWPGEAKIQKLVDSASGQFIYASTVIRFLRDQDTSTETQTQLDIILGLKPRTTGSARPFANLDRIYIEILARQSDQKFLNTFLPLLVASHLPRWRNELSKSKLASPIYFIPVPAFSFQPAYPHLSPGYGILMGMSEQDLHKKLRRMRSLLNFTLDDIGLHHRSFIEFLRDPSRSGQYNISTEAAVKQQLLFTIASVVRAAEQAIDQPNHHPPIPGSNKARFFASFDRRYSDMLSEDDLREVFRPLLKFEDRLFNLPNIVPRNECTVFHVVNNFLSKFSYYSHQREKNVIGLELAQNLLEGFSSLLTYIRRLKRMFRLMNTLLYVKPEVVATEIRSWSEAQNLMDLTYLVVNGKYLPTSLWGENVTRKAVQLAFEIHMRVPVLLQFIDFNDLAMYASIPHSGLVKCWSGTFKSLSQALLVSNFMDHRYIATPWSINWLEGFYRSDSSYIQPFFFNERDECSWRTSSEISSSKEKMFFILNLARTIQYLHSMGFVLDESAFLRVRLSLLK